MLEKKFKGYNVVWLTSLTELHTKYEGSPYYILFNEQEFRPATDEEVWKVQSPEE